MGPLGGLTRSLLSGTGVERAWFVDYGEQLCKLVGGLALFLYGMQLGSRELTKLAGGNLKLLLGKLTNNRFLGVFTGMSVTVLVQSSSATTVILVGLGSAGLLSLRQALGVILGADIGTTLTIQLIAFDLANYALLGLSVGTFIYLVSGYEKRKSVGLILVGFGLVFYGMHIMKEGVAPLKTNESFLGVLRDFHEQPLLGLLVGTVFTGIIQSSGATLAVVLALAHQGLVTLPGAIPIILGANVGTCATALLSSIGASRTGLQVAVAHLFFKMAGVLLCLPFVAPFASFTDWLTSVFSDDLARRVANAHTLFNVANTLVFLPLLSLVVSLVNRVVPARRGGAEGATEFIQRKVTSAPAVALALARKEVGRLGQLVLDGLREAFPALEGDDSKLVARIRRQDDQIDLVAEAITNYVADLSPKSLNEDQVEDRSLLLHATKELEHIGDLATEDLMGLAEKRSQGGIAFSMEGARDLRDLHGEVTRAVELAVQALAEEDLGKAAELLELESQTERTKIRLFAAHDERLRKGVVDTQESSRIFTNTVAALRFISYSAAEMGRALLRSKGRGAERRETLADVARD